MPGDQFCCEGCFSYPWLKSLAAGNRTEKGRCVHCGSHGWLAPIGVLYEPFINLISDYMPGDVANGVRDHYYPSVSLIDAIQRDWQLFSASFLRDGFNGFLPALFNGRPLPSGLPSLGVSVVPFHRNAMSTAYGKWMGFRQVDDAAFAEWAAHPQVGDVNFVGSFAYDAAQHLKDFVTTIAAGFALYRARANYIGAPFDDRYQPLPLTEMGCNPCHPASRLNRSGQKVLYCAESETTAIAEIRPGRGYICTVSKMRTTLPIQVLDLAAPLEKINPFLCDHLSWNLDKQRVAQQLSWFVAKPISRGEDSAVYARTQFIGDIVRWLGFQGVRFPSSLDFPSGVNLALFDPSLAEAISTHAVQIERTEVSFHAIDESGRKL